MLLVTSISTISLLGPWWASSPLGAPGPQEPMTNQEAPTTSYAGHHPRSSRRLISPWGTGNTPTCSEPRPSPLLSTHLSIQMTDISALTPCSPPAHPGLSKAELDPVLAIGCLGFGFRSYWGESTSPPRSLILCRTPRYLAGCLPVCFSHLILGLVTQRPSEQREIFS